jgi:hypothetical protein
VRNRGQNPNFLIQCNVFRALGEREEHYLPSSQCLQSLKDGRDEVPRDPLIPSVRVGRNWPEYSQATPVGTQARSDETVFNPRTKSQRRIRHPTTRDEVSICPKCIWRHLEVCCECTTQDRAGFRQMAFAKRPYGCSLGCLLHSASSIDHLGSNKVRGDAPRSRPFFRGFLPWRHSDAGPACAASSRRPASETLHTKRHDNDLGTCSTH